MKLFLPALFILAASATAQSNGYVTEVVYVNDPASPFNVVPGLGIPFASGNSSFQRVYTSPNGEHWAIEVRADSTAAGGSAFDNLYIVDGAVLIQEGTQAPWAATGETVGTLDNRIGINDSGTVLLTNNTGGTANTGTDDYVVAYAGGVFSIVAREGDLVDPIVPSLAGAMWDSALTSPTLDNLGNYCWEASSVDGTPGGSTDDNMLVLGMGLMALENDIPVGQAGGATFVWQNFDAEEHFVSGDGATTLVRGDTNNPISTEDDMLVLNGTVVLQENFPIPGGPFVEPIDVGGLDGSWLDGAGNWYARGDNDVTAQDWIVRNGTVVAMSQANQEIVAGSGEHWNDTTFTPCFFAMDGNMNGAYVLGGTTDAPIDSNSVLVVDDGLGNRVVAAREGDPVDVDGNGLFDDDRFYRVFGTDSVRVLGDRSLLFVSTLQDGAGAGVGKGLFRVNLKWTPYSVGTGATNVLSLGGQGSTSLGATFTAVTSGIVASSPASLSVISLGSASVPLFGGVLLVNPATIQNQILVGINVGGTSFADVVIPVSPTLIGLKTYFQSVANDPAQALGKALSNGLEVTLCE